MWSGGKELEAIRIKTAGPAHLAPISHFGSGVLTFHVTVLFRTEPGINLWVTGPVNRPKDGIAPLSGVIETDWAPYTFTMNWLFTRPGQSVRFRRVSRSASSSLWCGTWSRASSPRSGTSQAIPTSLRSIVPGPKGGKDSTVTSIRPDRQQALQSGRRLTIEG